MLRRELNSQPASQLLPCHAMSQYWTSTSLTCEGQDEGPRLLLQLVVLMFDTKAPTAS